MPEPALPPPSANRLLAALPLEVLQRVQPHLEPVALEPGRVLAHAESAPEWVYFPVSGLASRTVSTEHGEGVDILPLGREGMTGLPLVIGDGRSPFGITVQIAGHGWRLPARRFQRLQARPALRALTLRYAGLVLAQVGRQAVCCRHHTAQQRLARWLLMAADRTGEATFQITHDALSALLGTRRAGVTIAAGELQAAGLVAVKRGELRIVDRPGLEQASCICWCTGNQEYFRTIGIALAGDAQRT